MIHKINANCSGFIEILLRAFLSICEPIQNKPSNKKHWLMSFMKLMVWLFRSINEPIAIARMKNITKKGSLDLFDGVAWCL